MSFVSRSLHAPLKSSWRSPKSGIPQGTVLGPVLFLTFINDLPQSLTCECSIFADDSTAYTAGKDTQLTCRKLSLNRDYASDWASSWGMLFSAEKSEHLQIAPKTQNLNQSDVFMHGSYIPRVTTHKHLGVHINSLAHSWQSKHMFRPLPQPVGIDTICFFFQHIMLFIMLFFCSNYAKKYAFCPTLC